MSPLDRIIADLRAGRTVPPRRLLPYLERLQRAEAEAEAFRRAERAERTEYAEPRPWVSRRKVAK